MQFTKAQFKILKYIYKHPEDNGYYEKLPTTLAHCICTDRGSLEVETNLFNWKAFLFSKVADVIAAVITSLITCYLFLLLHLSS